ncbi:winged helix-turn-helix domain-containing protein [Serratia marcescens]|uniref:winged helix-turn-helix domain-containing protein n=1 Tax=Serratia marcescens TaxID=615 RepID=UPI002776ACDB|nr:winged helix-turn-helix domain-containing protein [Serratia marcescens]MDP8642012.1 winged helix-turn-helix domain-containing protein [Serratia marcescens]
MNILLVEDDLQLGKALCRALELTGFNLCWVRLLSDAENKLSPGGFDLMLLDLTLPDGDGLQKLIAWRAAGQNIPIIILTARDRNELLMLSKKEYHLLHELMRCAGTVVRKAVLEQRLFGHGDSVESNSLEVHMHNLRRKIGKERIITVRGIGYLLKKE